MERRLLFGLFAILVLAAMPADGAPSFRGEDFRTDELYLTTATGPAGAGDLSGNLLQPDVVGPQGTINYAPIVDQGVGSIPVIGDPITDALNTQSEAVWYWDGAWGEDRILTDSVQVALYLRAQADVVGTLTVGLYEILPAGTVHLLAQHTESVSVGTVSGQLYTYDLATQDTPVMHESGSLRLTISLSGASALTFLDYDDASTPSRIIAMAHELLDTDGDGVGDSRERSNGSNPKDPRDPRDARRDTDGDGLSDQFEADTGTDPFSPDTDGDGAGDGVEFHAGTDPLDSSDTPVDDDGDQLPDDWERKHFGDLSPQATDDPDGDGCDNFCELANGTDPNKEDTDGDGINDGDEIAQGTNPLLDPILVETDFGIWEVVGGSVLFVTSMALVGVGLFSRHAL